MDPAVCYFCLGCLLTSLRWLQGLSASSGKDIFIPSPGKESGSFLESSHSSFLPTSPPLPLKDHRGNAEGYKEEKLHTAGMRVGQVEGDLGSSRREEKFRKPAKNAE